MFKRFLFSVALTGAAGMVQAATTSFYDEATSGDLGYPTAVDLGSLNVADGDQTITGSIQATGAAPADEWDAFKLNLAQDSYVTVTFSPETADFLGQMIYAPIAPSAMWGPFGPVYWETVYNSGTTFLWKSGGYEFRTTSQQNSGDFDYTFLFAENLPTPDTPSQAAPPVPTPLPGGIAIYVPILAGLGAVAMRRRKRAA